MLISDNSFAFSLITELNQLPLDVVHIYLQRLTEGTMFFLSASQTKKVRPCWIFPALNLQTYKVYIKRVTLSFHRSLLKIRQRGVTLSLIRALGRFSSMFE